MPEHRETRHGGKQRADPEVFVTFPKLLHSRLFIRVVHEINITFEDLWIVHQRVFDQQSVFFVFFVAEHMHEGTVVNPVHAKRTHKVTFHQPKSFSQKEGIRNFCCNPIHHFTPKFFRHDLVKAFFGHGVIGTGRDISTAAWLREPQTLIVFFGQGHGCIEADDREFSGDIKNGLDDRFAYLRIQIVQLSRIVPGHAGSVVAMIDETGSTGVVVVMFEYHSCISAGVVMIFQVDANARTFGEIRSIELISREGRLICLDEPIRVVIDPVRVDCHVIRDHIAGEPDPSSSTSLGKVVICLISTQPCRDLIACQGIGRSHRVGIASHLFYFA